MLCTHLLITGIISLILQFALSYAHKFYRVFKTRTFWNLEIINRIDIHLTLINNRYRILVDIFVHLFIFDLIIIVSMLIANFHKIFIVFHYCFTSNRHKISVLYTYILYIRYRIGNRNFV